MPCELTWESLTRYITTITYAFWWGSIKAIPTRCLFRRASSLGAKRSRQGEQPMTLENKWWFVTGSWMNQRRQWHPTPVLLPGKSHGRRSLEGCSPQGCEESDTTERLHFHALEKEMATHSSVLAWRIPGTGEPGGLPSVGSHRVGHDWSDLAAAAAISSNFAI